MALVSHLEEGLKNLHEKMDKHFALMRWFNGIVLAVATAFISVLVILLGG